MAFNQDTGTGNMIIQGTGTAGAVPISGSVTVSSVAITGNVTVQAPGGSALALDSTLTGTIYQQLLLANWINQPYSGTSQYVSNNYNAGDQIGSSLPLYSPNPVTGLTGPYFNQVTFQGQWNQPPSITGYIIYLEYTYDNLIWIRDVTLATIAQYSIYENYFYFVRNNLVASRIRFRAYTTVNINDGYITLQHNPSLY
jgi:hypothetical protein